MTINARSRTEYLNLTIAQGADYRVLFLIKDDHDVEIDCTGWIAKSEIRNAPASSQGKLITTFSPTFLFSTNTVRSVLQLLLPKTETIKLKEETLYWDLDLTNTFGWTETPRTGEVKVILQYTI